VEVTLDVREGQLDPRHRYSIWAHVDHSGTGKLQRGDLITTTDIPVPADDVASGRVLEIRLTRI
jgi:hypothetical protein